MSVIRTSIIDVLFSENLCHTLFPQIYIITQTHIQHTHKKKKIKKRMIHFIKFRIQVLFYIKIKN